MALLPNQGGVMMNSSMSNSLNTLEILEQAINHIANSFALESQAVSDILQLEKAMVQKATQDSTNLEEFVSVNESVNSVILNIHEILKMTQTNLRLLEKALQDSNTR